MGLLSLNLWPSGPPGQTKSACVVIADTTMDHPHTTISLSPLSVSSHRLPQPYTQFTSLFLSPPLSVPLFLSLSHSLSLSFFLSLSFSLSTPPLPLSFPSLSHPLTSATGSLADISSKTRPAGPPHTSTPSQGFTHPLGGKPVSYTHPLGGKPVSYPSCICEPEQYS